MDLARRASFLLPLSLLGGGCRKPTRSPEAVADAFLDAYYVERNHDHALTLSSDAAAERVAAEKKLVAEAGGAYGGIQPKVYYQRRKLQLLPDGAEVSFELTIDSGGAQFRKALFLRIKGQGEDYRVVFFDEKDLAAAAP